ncbi:hypothetical protein A2303_00340 [Candidatus Falkowbacteria bacterium RIFOXYB2_FULL_47_14]|uniref:PLD phosphodiesterase domain-containing protein n=1 Tax=Candidatus Falkowbacteria bacterium RIFOXYA2_FULL_47_19 TaxID=1797994 RepID=A0A1F5SNT3_9BACT|nr:MAG: hypothetical protein A2227_05385 [Candidatus Falkowbacteria bacterium RIFOXYA2_FULL_47_19]OGF43007.1 MAG: hypothetical protein A2303_00340 [Candidatus Falkowbacteria bacterium RIFOXYB2_FULL_47_14]
MDFSKNIKTGLSFFPFLKTIKDEEKFTLVAAFIAKGDKSQIKISDVNKRRVWNRELLGGPFSYKRHYYKAISRGLVEPTGKTGYFIVSKKGYITLERLADEVYSKEVKRVGELVIFNKKATNTFDIYLKNILKKAKQRVLIVDSYISDVLFDDVLRAIQKDIPTKLLYGKIENPDSFNRKLVRFKTEWVKFNIKNNKDIHDRFIIVDNFGYILGPSIKDAADKSPCILVALNQDETVLLSDFFKELWIGK